MKHSIDTIKRKVVFQHPDPRNEKLTIMLSATEYQRFIDYCNERQIPYSTQGRLILIESLDNRDEWLKLEKALKQKQSDLDTAWLCVQRFLCRYSEERRRFENLVAYLKTNNIKVPIHLITRTKPHFGKVKTHF